MEQARKADDQKAIEEAMAQRARQAATPEAQEQAEQARAALESVFGALGSDGGSTSQDMLSAVWFDPADFGISWAAFSETYYDGFTWEFGEATGDGQGSATVEATLHVKQMARGIGLMRQAMESAQAQGADVAQTGSADDAFSQAVSGADWPCDDIRVEVELERGSDGQWAVANRQVLAAALLDGYDPRQAS